MILICLYMDIQLFSIIIEKTVLSSLIYLCTLVENWLSIYVWVYLYTLYSVSLIFLSVLIPVPHCTDDCVDDLMSDSVSPPTLIFISKSILTVPGSLHFYVNFIISLSISTKKPSFRLRLHQINRSI